MKKTLLLNFISLISFLVSNAQSASFDSRSIPEALKRNASLIKRYENIEFEVSDLDRATLNVHEILTILNEKSKEKLDFYIQTNKYIILDEAELKVYDSTGKQIGKIRKKDMSTSAAGEGLIDDGYVTGYSISARTYPITIECNYQIKFKQTLGFPDYSICTANEAVENSIYTAKVPKEFDLRFKPINTSIAPEISDEGKFKIYKWAVKNLPAEEYEEGASPDNNYPEVLLAPNKFSFYGKEGSLTSWKSFGEWIGNLYLGTDELQDDRKKFFQDLVKNAPNEREKARIIYDYLQKNFRYVSIQLGIGGLKPFPADFTDQKKYGDCKGLSTYMKAALKAVGVKSYVAVINAEYNREPVDPNFPVNSFNHAIVCIPQDKDSIWLECTSQTIDFGELSSATRNRNALLVTEQGGALVPTPRSRPDKNKFSSITRIQLAEDGSGNSQSALNTIGEYKELFKEMMRVKDEDKKTILVNYFGFKQPDEFKLQEKANNDCLLLNLEMNIERIPELKAGNKMFLGTRLYSLWWETLPKSENRRHDFYFETPFIRIDTTIIKLPQGYKPDALPAAKNSKCEFASYITKYWYNENEKAIYSTATLELIQNRIPAAKYAAVKTFFDDVLMDNSQRIVIKKD